MIHLRCCLHLRAIPRLPNVPPPVLLLPPLMTTQQSHQNHPALPLPSPAAASQSVSNVPPPMLLPPRSCTCISNQSSTRAASYTAQHSTNVSPPMLLPPPRSRIAHIKSIIHPCCFLHRAALYQGPSSCACCCCCHHAAALHISNQSSTHAASYTTQHSTNVAPLVLLLPPHSCTYRIMETSSCATCSPTEKSVAPPATVTTAFSAVSCAVAAIPAQLHQVVFAESIAAVIKLVFIM